MNEKKHLVTSLMNAKKRKAKLKADLQSKLKDATN